MNTVIVPLLFCGLNGVHCREVVIAFSKDHFETSCRTRHLQLEHLILRVPPIRSQELYDMHNRGGCKNMLSDL